MAQQDDQVTVLPRLDQARESPATNADHEGAGVPAPLVIIGVVIAAGVGVGYVVMRRRKSSEVLG